MTYASQMLNQWANVGCVKCGATHLPTIGHEPCPGRPECPPHLWIRDGSGAVCTECGREITEVEKYAPFERHER